MLEIAMWMIGSESNCPHCRKKILLSIGDDYAEYFPVTHSNGIPLESAVCKSGDLIGPYQVIRCLGIGGMGEVYLVEHTRLKKRCALKLMKNNIASENPDVHKRLIREAVLASKVRHPNLVAVFDAELVESSPSCYIAMEYVDGVSIENILAFGPMQEERALEIIDKVAGALEFASEYRIIHRDIKPANIMLSRTGEVKLTDLGIAKVAGDNQQVTLTRDNAILGTPNYSSPEQLRSANRVDSRTDIYSLGATLYHMLTGVRPFEAESIFNVMANVLEKNLPPVHEVNPAVSVKTSMLVCRMMEKRRNDRPADFTALRRELKALMNRGKKKKNLFLDKLSSWISIRHLLLILFVLISLVAGIKLSGLLLKGGRTSAERLPASVKHAAPERRGSMRPRSRRMGIRQERSLPELKRDAADQLEIFDRSNVNELRAVDIKNAVQLASYIYFYEPQAPEIEALDRAVTVVFPAFFRTFAKQSDNYAEFKDIFDTVGVIDGASLDIAWNTAESIVRQRYTDALMQDDIPEIDNTYKYMMQLDEASPYKDSPEHYRKLQYFIRYGKFIEAKKYLDSVNIHKDIYNVLKNKLDRSISVRQERLKNFISHARAQRDHFSVRVLNGEQKALRTGTPQGERMPASHPESSRLKSLKYLCECGNEWAARQLTAAGGDADFKIIDSVTESCLQKLASGADKNASAESLAVITAFLESGYEPDAAIAGKLLRASRFDYLKIKVRKQSRKPKVKTVTAQSSVVNHTPTGEEASFNAAGVSSPQRDTMVVATGVTVPEPNSGGRAPQAERAPAETPEKVKENEKTVELRLAPGTATPIKFRYLLIDALKQCNVRRLKYFVEHKPELSVDARKALAFVRAFLKAEYFSARSIYNSYNGIPQVKTVMEELLAELKRLMFISVLKISQAAPLDSELTRYEIEISGDILRTYSNVFSDDLEMSSFFRQAKDKWYHLQGRVKRTMPSLSVLLNDAVGLRYFIKKQKALFMKDDQAILRNLMDNLSGSTKKGNGTGHPYALWLNWVTVLESGADLPDEYKKLCMSLPQLDDFFPVAEQAENFDYRSIAGAVCDIDFSNLTSGQKKMFHPGYVQHGRLKFHIDAHKSRNKSNIIDVVDLPAAEFTVSMLIFPRFSRREKYDRYSPLFCAEHPRNFFALTTPKHKLMVSFNQFADTFDTGLPLSPGKWHSCQISVSLLTRKLEVIVDGTHKSFTLPRDFTIGARMNLLNNGKSFSFTNRMVRRSFNGDVKHIRIYPFALDAEELKELSGEFKLD